MHCGIGDMLVGVNQELLYYPERRFDFPQTAAFLLPNDMRSVPTTIWDASVVLAMVVAGMGCSNEREGERTNGFWDGRTVVELGAGTAMPSIVAARFGATAVATDLREELDVTCRCIDAASKPIPGENSPIEGRATPRATMDLPRSLPQGVVVPCALRWGNALDPVFESLLSRKEDGRNNDGTTAAGGGSDEKEHRSNVDIVLGADIVYNDAFVGELVDTLLKLLQCGGRNGATTVAFISYEQRRRDMQATFFDRLEEAGCQCTQLRSPMLDYAAQAARVFVFQVVLAAPAPASAESGRSLDTATGSDPR